MTDAISVSEIFKTKENKFNIEVSAFIKASAETIYEIITDKDGFADFMGCELQEEIRLGGPIIFIFDVAYTDESGVTHAPPAISSGKVVSMVPHELFSFTWGDGRSFNKDFPPGSTLVEFKIATATENGINGCRVTIHHYDLPSEYLANDHSGGWQYHLGNCISKYS